MIVVTVGTQFFDELVDEVDRLVSTGVIQDQVWAQIGLARRSPKHLTHVAFDSALVEKARTADLIISHSGTGSLCEFVTLGRPLIAVVNPTKADNHQLEFVEALSELYDFCWVDSPSRLAEALPQARVPKRVVPSSAGRLAADIRAHLVNG